MNAFETTIEIQAITKEDLSKILEQIRTILMDDDTCENFYINDIESYHVR